jgi:hypothetical protein
LSRLLSCYVPPVQPVSHPVATYNLCTQTEHTRSWRGRGHGDTCTKSQTQQRRKRSRMVTCRYPRDRLIESAAADVCVCVFANGKETVTKNSTTCLLCLHHTPTVSVCGLAACRRSSRTTHLAMHSAALLLSSRALRRSLAPGSPGPISAATAASTLPLSSSPSSVRPVRHTCSTYLAFPIWSPKHGRAMIGTPAHTLSSVEFQPQCVQNAAPAGCARTSSCGAQRPSSRPRHARASRRRSSRAGVVPRTAACRGRAPDGEPTGRDVRWWLGPRLFPPARRRTCWRCCRS